MHRVHPTRVRTRTLGLLLAALAVQAPPRTHAGCPPVETVDGHATVTFPDGSVAIRAGLQVNPDGARASYTVGDHGFTYVANGLALWRHDHRLECKSRVRECNAAFRAAEAQDFAAGTAEFCVFAMEVDPPPGRPATRCPGGLVAGNGKGRPRTGETLRTIAGDTTHPYVSTTALRHDVNGVPTAIDSASVPTVVIPTSAASGLGQIVWVRARAYPGHEVLAVAGDTGPAFGEGSIALHQLLRTGTVTSQDPGPIPSALRCSAAELELRPPFESRPDVRGDRCREGEAPQGASDVRAYAAMPGLVDFVRLAGATMPRRGSVVTREITGPAIAAQTEAAGYTLATIRAMAACLDAPAR